MTLYLVTGGAGFIGSHIVEALLSHGARVRVLDNLTTGKRSNIEHLPVEIIVGDVRESAAVQSAMKGVDFVIHQAAVVSVPQSMIDPITTHEVNVTGTLNILLAARHNKVRHVVFASSCAVYGDNSELPLKESAAVKPLSPYAASKLAGEIYCQTFQQAYGLPTTCLRYFNVYGPRQDPNGDYAAVIPKFAERIRCGQSPVIYGDGLQSRDFIHVSDVVSANLAVCESQSTKGQILNVSSGQSTSLLDLVSTMSELCCAQITPQFEPPRTGDILHSRGDNTRLEMVLGYRPKVPLAAGLQPLLH
jgi:UDP-glucose 4-epimerase